MISMSSAGQRAAAACSNKISFDVIGCYDDYIMMSRTQVSLDPEMQRLGRTRASELGVSFAEYIRRLVARDLDQPRRSADTSMVFALGNSGATDIVSDKDKLVGEAVASSKAYSGEP